MRILQNSSATVTGTLLGAGGDVAAPPPTTATVTITRDVGPPVATAASTLALGAGVFSFPLTTADTALLDRLTLDWVDTASGAATRTYVEVVGGFLFSVPQARAALGDSAYDSAKIQEARTYAETEIENALGFALVPRYANDTVPARRRDIRLRPFVRAIRSASVNVAGTVTALTASDLGLLTTSHAGYVSGYNWPAGYVSVAYEHGLDAGNDLMSGAQRYALAAAVEYLGGGTGSIDPRAERLITDDGTIVYGSTSGGQFRALGVSEWVAANRLPMVA